MSKSQDFSSTTTPITSSHISTSSSMSTSSLSDISTPSISTSVPGGGSSTISTIPTPHELYRIYHGWIQKLTPSLISLHSSAAYLLISYNLKKVEVWIGCQCNRLDHVLAENIGHKILYEEFKISTLSNPLVVLHQNQQPSSFFVSFFHLQTPTEYHPNAIPSNDLLNDQIYLSELTLPSLDSINGNSITSISIELKQIVTIVLNSTKISYPHFTSDSIILYESGIFERYLWIGKKVLKKYHSDLFKYAETHSQCPSMNSSSPLIIIRDGMEPFLYLERFKNIQETFPKFQKSRRHSDGGAILSKVVKKTIANEIPRMVGSGFGTLSMVVQGFGTDSTSSGIKMDFVHDSSSEASLWKIDDKTRKFIRVPDEERGIFHSSGCYALLYRCKNGARNILFLWIGDESRPDLRAALAIQWSTITPPNVAVDHVQVRQNSEPPIFAAICFHHFHQPLCILDGIPIQNVFEPTTFILDIYSPYIGLRDTCPSAVQLFPANQPLSVENIQAPSSFRCRMTIPIIEENGVLKIDQILIQRGSDTSPLLAEATMKIFQNLEKIVHVGVSNSITGEISPSIICKSKAINEQHIDNSLKTKNPQRPIRLFRISVDRRNIGALFVEEIGVGGMFKQTDLQETECYILDSGANLVFIWHGLESSYHGQALCTRVCRHYIAELHKEHDVCASPEFRAIFPLPAVDNIEIVYTQSGNEALEFMNLFPRWIRRTDSSLPMVCSTFDPSNITDDELADDKFDKSGKVVTTQKIRYSDVINSRTQQPSMSPPSDNLENQIDSLPQRKPSDSTAKYPSSSSKQDVPEFIAKRNALKAVHCPDINYQPLSLSSDMETSTPRESEPMNTIELSLVISNPSSDVETEMDHQNRIPSSPPAVSRASSITQTSNTDSPLESPQINASSSKLTAHTNSSSSLSPATSTPPSQQVKEEELPQAKCCVVM